MAAIDATAELRTYGAPVLGLFTYGSERLDPFALWGRMLRRGWFSGLTTEPRAVHLMLSPAHATVADAYLEDLSQCVAEVAASGERAADTRARYA
jgi:sphinganine-1-phosphate aldolase